MITIKIDGIALETMCFYLDEFMAGIHPKSLEQKVVFSIMQKTMVKMRKKAIDKEGEMEKFKLKFEYYEAFALEKALRFTLDLVWNYPYPKQVCLSVANELNQSLELNIK